MIGNFGITEWLCTLAIIFAGIWYYLVANYNYWKQLGVPGPKPSIIFGNLRNIAMLRSSFLKTFEDLNREFMDAPMIGLYHFRTPILLLRDPDLIMDVMIKDFTNFTDRGFVGHDKVDPLNSNLFSIESKRWRVLRPKLSPAFTSSKMRHMFTLMLECAEYFEHYLGKLVERGGVVDCLEMTARFTTDIIGSCAFGIRMNALVDEDSEFRKMGKQAFSSGYKVRLLALLRVGMPWLYDLVGISVIPAEVTKFFTSTVKQTIEYRKENNIRGGDLIDLLMALKDGPPTPDLELTDSLLAAQAFSFFLAGFETSANTASHALLELAQRQDVQDKLRHEIVDFLKEHDGIITYDSIKKMKYLHMVFQETLRLRPPVPVHFRQAAADYTFRGTNITIRKGQEVWIPACEIQVNPKYYPNPRFFDPERFTEDIIKSRHRMTYTPFGDGPRNCIGSRFADYQTKLGLIKILSKYKVDISHKVQLPYKPEPTSFILKPVGGIHLKFSKISESS